MEEDRASGRATHEQSPTVSAVPVGIPDAMQFRAYIARVLTERPSYLRDALEAVSSGMAEAIEAANQRASLHDLATLSAMALSNGRVSKELRETLLARIVAAIHPLNQCGYERGYIDQFAQGIAAGTGETGTGSTEGKSPVRKDAPGDHSHD